MLDTGIKNKKGIDLNKIVLILFLFATFVLNHSVYYQILTILIMGLAMLSMLNRSVRIHGFFIWYALFILFAVVQIFFIGVYDKSASVNMLQTMCFNLVIFFFLTQYLNVTNLYSQALTLYVKVAFAAFALMLLLSLFSGDLLSGRFMEETEFSLPGATISYNANAISNIACVAATVLLFAKDRFSKGFRVAAFLLSWVVILFSGSRKTLLIGILVILYYLLRMTTAKLFLVRMVEIGVVVGIIAFLVFEVEVFYNTIGVRLESMVSYFFQDGAGDSSLTSRDYYIQYGWEIFKQHPLVGVGLANFMSYAQTAAYSHNDYIELLSGVGFVGTVLIYMPKLSVVFGTIKTRFKDFELYLVLMVEYFLLAYGTVSYYKREDWLIFIFALANIQAFRDCRRVKAS